MAHYTLVRNGRNQGVKALTDAMADRLGSQEGVELIPVAEPVHATWTPGGATRQARLRQERASFAEVIAVGRRG